VWTWIRWILETSEDDGNRLSRLHAVNFVILL